MDIYAFIGIPRFFFRAIGLVPFHIVRANQPPPKIPIWRNLHLMTFVSVLIADNFFTFLWAVSIRHRPELFIELTIASFYLIVSALAYSKLFTIIFNRPQLSAILTELNAIFPGTVSARVDYRLEHHVRRFIRLIRSYAILQMLMVVLCNVTPTFEALVGLYRTGNWRIDLPFEKCYPVDKYSRGWFEAIMLTQFTACFTVSTIVMATDILVCSILAQLSMHFEHLSFRLRQMRPGCCESKNVAELRVCILEHYRLIGISENMDNVFDICILFKMMASVILICLVGFLITVGSTFADLVKFACSFFSFVAPVLLISIFGDQFTESSLGIADSAWECDWYNGSRQFKLGIAILMHRAQRPQYLTAYKYSFVSMEMFTSVMSSSWQFFVLISSFYDE